MRRLSDRLSVVVLAVAVSGCALFARKKTASGWVVLDKADNAECARWPMRDKDLSVNDIVVLAGKQRGLVASGTKRDGSPMHVYAPFDGGVVIDKDSLRDLPLGRSAVVLGGGDIGGGMLLGVAQNVKEKATLELRTIKDNIVRLKTELAPTSVVGGRATSVAGGAWLAFNKDDNDHGLAYLDLRSATKPVAKGVAGLWLKETPEVVPMASGAGALVLTRDGDPSKPFKARQVGADGTAGAETAIDLAVESQAESWAATTFMGTHYLAFVDGDSLIGQASLRVAALGWGDGGASVKWTRAAPLKDVHVTEPLFVSTGKGLQILLLKWVDEESTIARYNVAGGNLGKPTFSGIFPKGARIVDAFVGEDADDVYVVVRHRERGDDSRWAFQLCRI